MYKRGSDSKIFNLDVKILGYTWIACDDPELNRLDDTCVQSLGIH